jgi:hypothetical protein
MSKRCALLGIALIVLFGALPFILTMVAVTIAQPFGCSTSADGPHPCIILGHDFAMLMYALANSFFFIVFTIPIAGVALIIWLVVWLVIHN